MTAGDGNEPRPPRAITRAQSAASDELLERAAALATTPDPVQVLVDIVNMAIEAAMRVIDERRDAMPEGEG